MIFFWLRSRRRKQSQDGRDGIPSSTASDIVQNPAAPYAVAGGDTPAYPPQASPPVPPCTWNGEQALAYYQHFPPNNSEWAYHADPAYAQNYYPSPPEPSHEHQRMHQYHVRAELPGLQSPVSAELSVDKSPVTAELPDSRCPAPKHAN